MISTAAVEALVICNNRVMWYWCNVRVKKQYWATVPCLNIHGEQKIVNLTTLSSLVAPLVVITTTYGAIDDYKVVKLITFLDLLFSVFLWFPIANITLTNKLLEIHGYVISTAAVEALVILYFMVEVQYCCVFRQIQFRLALKCRRHKAEPITATQLCKIPTSGLINRSTTCY